MRRNIYVVILYAMLILAVIYIITITKTKHTVHLRKEVTLTWYVPTLDQGKTVNQDCLTADFCPLNATLTFEHDKQSCKQKNVNLTSGITIMEDRLYLEYERYVTTLQTDCKNIARCGPNNDAGYDVCIDSAYKPTQPCLVYSFGSNFVFGFENDVYRRYNCEIHTFDPSVPIAGHRIPKGIKFHLIGLSDIDSKSIFGWNMKTLASIRKLLNHSSKVLDILKIDIEGDEWKAMPQFMASVSNKYIKQVVIEIHFGRRTNGLKEDGFMSYMLNYWGDASPFEQLNILKQLEINGFKIFRSYKNQRAKLQLQNSNEDIVFTTHVVSLINTNIPT